MFATDRASIMKFHPITEATNSGVDFSKIACSLSLPYFYLLIYSGYSLFEQQKYVSIYVYKLTSLKC